MKNQELDSSRTTISIGNQERDIFMNKQQERQTNEHMLKCIEGKNAQLFCHNKNCDIKFGFICLDKYCQCKKLHKKCLKADIQYVINTIRQKQNVKKFTDQVQQMFDSIIDQISKIRDHILVEIRQNLKNINLIGLQKQFIDIAYGKSDQQFYGQKLSSLWENLNQNQQSSFQKQLLNLIKIFQTQQKANLKRFSNSISLDIHNHKFIIKNANLQISSKIITKKQEEIRLIKFFNDKVKNMELIFRASQHKFKLQKFCQICQNKHDILIIAKTDKHKIIGAYTPFQMKCDFWYKDQANKSFVFSLTQNDKFNLVKNTQYAIYYCTSCIQVGLYYQFCIQNLTDKSSIGKTCFHPEGSFSNQKYTNSKESYLKFNGNQTYDNFFIIQWQAYQVNFKS